MTAQPQAAPVDAETATLLDVIATDRVHEDDRAKVEETIVGCAMANGRVLDPNDLRRALYNEHGCVVNPNVIGAVIHSLVRHGVLVRDGWVVTEGSTSGNDGKPARRYRLTT